MGMAVFEKIRAMLETLTPFEVRVSETQVALRRAKGFAYVWLPGRYLARPHAPVVLSIALDRKIDSPRFKQVVQPPTGPWMHHLEVQGIEELDDEVAGWLAEAAERAGGAPGRSSLAVARPRPRATRQ